MYNDSLPMKSYQFFKIFKRFDKEREKTLTQPPMKKEKLRKVGPCFTAGFFVKSFNMTINHFFVSQDHSQSKFCFLILG